jgi:arylsulfatase A-like enzyme
MNVIVVMLDSLRSDHLGCYGNSWIKTPNLDRFASEATVFRRFYAEGLPTLPVRTALFTGRYTLPYRGWQRLEPDDIPIAEILWDAGYVTALVSDTYHMHKPGMAYERGFDYVIWIRGQEGDPYIQDAEISLDVWHEKNWYVPSIDIYIPREQNKQMFIQYLKNTACWRRKDSWFIRSDEDTFVAHVMKSAYSLLKKIVEEDGRKDKIFMWIDSFDPHEPWDPPEEYYNLYAPPDYNGKPIIWGGGFAEEYTDEEIKHIRALYAAEVTVVDKWVGWFFDKIKELGLWENTMIIVLSDHGIPLGENGIIKKYLPWPYEVLSKAVLMIRHPEGVGRGRYIDARVETVDITPTILDFLGIDITKKRSPWSVNPLEIHGKSLIPLISGDVKEEEFREFAISGHYKRSYSIRWRNYTYITWPSRVEAPYQWGLYEVYRTRIEKTSPELYKVDRDYIPPPPKNYDWRKDVIEKENIIDIEKDVAKELEVKLRRKIMQLLKY